jgi:acyl-coenzyme A thioesterase PaaI-like protein
VAGLFLATPILIAVKAIGCELRSWAPVVDFLGPARAPPITARAREWRRLRKRLRTPVRVVAAADRKAAS